MYVEHPIIICSVLTMVVLVAAYFSYPFDYNISVITVPCLFAIDNDAYTNIDQTPNRTRPTSSQRTKNYFCSFQWISQIPFQRFGSGLRFNCSSFDFDFWSFFWLCGQIEYFFYLSQTRLSHTIQTIYYKLVELENKPIPYLNLEDNCMFA